MLRIYLLFLIVAVSGATEPKPEHQLNLRSQQVTTALMNNDTRTIYDLFVPAFRREIPFNRFDSAVRAWQNNRTIARIQSRVIDTKGRGGHISTFLFFYGEKEYRYLYQNWLFSDSGWQLVWISNILNQSFQFGTQDTPAMEKAALAALNYVFTNEGLKKVHLHQVPLPDTIFVFQPFFPAESTGFLKQQPVVWLAPEQDRKLRLPRSIPYYCQVEQIRIFGPIALVTIDFYPVAQPGKRALGRSRSLEIYLKADNAGWVFDSFGKLW
uniref:Uncharacterized protein n=1 Tax=candidate division WOR-3 bacterium TaxID=2052148 RepID=A0A7V3PSN4_UNCW3